MNAVTENSRFNPWPWAMVGILVATGIMNVVVYNIAISNKPDAVDSSPWERGQQFQGELDAQRNLISLGITHQLTITGAAEKILQLNLYDSANKPVTGAKLNAVLHRAASAADDAEKMLSESSPGVYTVSFSGGSGIWLVELTGTLNDTPIEIKKSVFAN